VKNPPEFYSEAYLKSPLSAADLSVTRWEDNGIFHSSAMAASRIATAVETRFILDVGCGRGFVVNHLRAMGYSAVGLEYGEAALKHSVCGASFCDLTEGLPYTGSPFGLVFCHGVLSHLPEESVPFALSELFRVTNNAFWMNVLTKKTPTQEHHKTFRPEEWWASRLREAGFVPLESGIAIPVEWFAPSPEQAMFLVRKP
jgi:SAM-dependent methyltransferase